MSNREAGSRDPGCQKAAPSTGAGASVQGLRSTWDRGHIHLHHLCRNTVLGTASFLSFSVCLKKMKTKPEYEKVRMQRNHSPSDTSLLVMCDFKGRETKGEEGQFASNTTASARQQAAAASQSA